MLLGLGRAHSAQQRDIFSGLRLSSRLDATGVQPTKRTHTHSEVGSDVHALIKELAIRRIEHRSETHTNESQHLAERTEVARLRRRFSFVLQKEHSLRNASATPPCPDGGACAMKVPAVKQKRIVAEEVLQPSLPPDVGTRWCVSPTCALPV